MDDRHLSNITKLKRKTLLLCRYLTRVPKAEVKNQRKEKSLCRCRCGFIHSRATVHRVFLLLLPFPYAPSHLLHLHVVPNSSQVIDGTYLRKFGCPYFQSLCFPMVVSLAFSPFQSLPIRRFFLQFCNVKSLAKLFPNFSKFN